MPFIFLDESGDTSKSPSFLVCMFFTDNPRFWEEFFIRIRAEEKYPYELKFKKISSNKRDGRYRTAKKLIAGLKKNPAKFYCRCLVVDRKLVDKSRFGGSNQIEYNYFVESLVLHYTQRLTQEALLTLDFRQREREDKFIPEKLQSMLNARSASYKKPLVKLQIKDSKEEPLLQLTDIIVGALHQVYFPSKNGNKLELAKGIRSLIDNKIYVWTWVPKKIR